MFLIDYVDLQTGCSFEIVVHVTDGYVLYLFQIYSCNIKLCFYRIESQYDDAVLLIGVIKDDQTVKLLSSIESESFPKSQFEK